MNLNLTRSLVRLHRPNLCAYDADSIARERTSLREAVSYPSVAGTASNEAIRAALIDCQLPGLAPRLDELDHWGQRLSPGEQQRLSFARALLNRPDWLFLDEATAALDTETEQHLDQLMLSRLPGTTLISIAHRPTVIPFHARQISLKSENGLACG